MEGGANAREGNAGGSSGATAGNGALAKALFDSADAGADDAGADGATVLVVSHGGFLHALLNRVLDLRHDGALGNCSLSVLQLQQGLGR